MVASRKTLFPEREIWCKSPDQQKSRLLSYVNFECNFGTKEPQRNFDIDPWGVANVWDMIYLIKWLII